MLACYQSSSEPLSDCDSASALRTTEGAGLSSWSQRRASPWSEGGVLEGWAGQAVTRGWRFAICGPCALWPTLPT